jgi:hypothetical protein
MASLTSTVPWSPVPSLPSADRRAWPVGWRLRGLIRLAFSVPYIGLAIAAYRHGYSDSANAALERRSVLIHWGSSNLSFVGHVYPPLPLAVAALSPNAVTMAVIGALAAGSIIEILASRLASRGYPLWAVLVLVAMFGASPSFARTATSDLSAFMALSFLALALAGFIRFAYRGETHGGFQAGLAIGLAGLCDPAAVVFAIGFAVAAPLIAHQRFRSERAAGRATAAVLLFPTAAGISGWIFLCWRFSGSPLGWLRSAAPDLWHEPTALAHIGHSLHEVLLPMWLTPVYLLAVLIPLAQRRARVAAGVAMPLVFILIATVIGVPLQPASIAVVLGVAGLTSLPNRPSRTLLTIILVVAGAGLAAKWGYPAGAQLQAWERAVGFS